MQPSSPLQKAFTLFQSGHHDKALKALDKYLKARPSDFDGVNLKSLIYIQKNNPAQAVKLLSQFSLFDGNPRNRGALNTLGMAHKALRQFEQAIECFQAAFQLNDKSIEVGLNLISCNIQGRHFVEAIELAKLLKSIVSSGLRAPLSMLQGEAYYGLENYEEAFKFFDEAIEQSSSKTSLKVRDYIHIAELFERHTMTDRSRKAAEKGLSHYPEEVSLSLFLSKCDYADKAFSAGLKRIEGLSVAKSSPQLKADFHTELGVLNDAMGNYERAFENFVTANQCQKPIYRLAKVKTNQDVQKMMECFSDPSWLERWKRGGMAKKGKSPVFLIGFPRSGTTLLENMLDSHSKIETLPEMGSITELRNYLAKKYGNYPKCLSDLNDDECQKLQDMYFDVLENRYTIKGQAILVDKLPLNINNIGLIKKVFPDSKIILATRHPYDCVLSCFMQNFLPNSEMAYFHSLQSTAKRYQDIFNLWNIYIDNIDVDYHQIRYEDLVVDVKGEVTALLEFLGVDYEEGVNQYSETAKNKGAYVTPSYRQISQPIYNSSKYRWKNYEKHFDGLEGQLAPFLKQFDYRQ